MHASNHPKFRRARLLLAVALALAGAGVAWVLYSLPEGSWRSWVDSLSVSTLLIALTVLPIFGFPISVLHIAAGARFGLGLGSVAVALSTLAHLLATYLLAQLLEGPLRRVLGVFGWHLPKVPAASAWPFGFWIALLPGVSYALKNAVPPLASVSLRVYIGTALPTHIATSLIGLGIGRATMEFSWPLAAGVAAYAAILAVLTRKLARHFRTPPLAGDAAAITLAQTPDLPQQEGGRT